MHSKLIRKTQILNKFNNAFALTVATAIIPVVFQVWYVRYASYEIDPQIFGRFTLLLTLAAVSTTIFWTIPSTAFVRYFNETTDRQTFINEFRFIQLLINILSAMLVLVYCGLDDETDLMTASLLILFIIFQNNASLNKQIILQGLWRKKYFVISTLDKIFRYLFPVLLFYYFRSLNALLVGILLGSILVNLLGLIYNQKYSYGIICIPRKIKIYFAYGFPLIFTSLFSWIIVFSDRYFIQYFMGEASVGQYSILAQVASFSSILNIIFSMYVNPIIYKDYSENKKRAIKKLFLYIRKFAIVLTAIFLIFIVTPKEFFSILINPAFIESDDNYQVFLSLFLASIISVFQNSISLIFTLNKRLDALAVIWAAAATVNIIGNFFIAEYGLIAASFSTCISYSLVVILNFVWLSRNPQYKSTNS